MGFKKGIMKNYCDDSMGFRIPSQRKGKEGNKKYQQISNRKEQNVAVRLSDIRIRSPSKASHGIFGNDLLIHNQKMERKQAKKLNRTRNKQRLEKYESNSMEDCNEESEEQNKQQEIEKQDPLLSISSSPLPSSSSSRLTSVRIPSPLSPVKLWKKKPVSTTTAVSKLLLTSSNLSLDMANLSIEYRSSPFSKSLEAVIFSLEKNPESFSLSIPSSSSYLSKVTKSPSTSTTTSNDVLDTTILTRCGEVIYGILFPNKNSNMVMNESRWDEADSDHDDHDDNNNDDYNHYHHKRSIERTTKSWLIQTFLDRMKGSYSASRLIESLNHSGDDVLSQSSLHINILQRISSLLVLEYFFVSSTTFMTSLMEGMITEDDHVISSRLSVLQALYQLGNKQIQKSMLYSLYDITLDRVQRCTTAESIAKYYELDVNHLAQQNFLQDVKSSSSLTENDHGEYDDNDNNSNNHSSIKALSDTIQACNATSQGKSGVNEENVCYRVTNHVSSIIQLTRFVIIKESKFNCISKSTNTSNSEIYTCKMEVLSRIVINLFRGYGYSLGSMAEIIENIALLNCLKAILSELIQLIQCHSNSDSYLDILLKSFLRYWPKSSYVREVAFIDAMVIILSAHSLPSSVKTSTINQISTSKKENDWNASVPIHLILSVPSITTTIFYIERSLNKLLSLMTSSHFKVSHRVIVSFQSNQLLERYFITNDEDTISIENIKTELLSKLVSNLRINRSHWHPSVQSAASTTFDLVFLNCT